jgi:hypothetical protein
VSLAVYLRRACRTTSRHSGSRKALERHAYTQTSSGLIMAS